MEKQVGVAKTLYLDKTNNILYMFKFNPPLVENFDLNKVEQGAVRTFSNDNITKLKKIIPVESTVMIVKNPTDADINKMFGLGNRKYIMESYNDYVCETQPKYLQNKKSLKWIENILQHNSETILYEDMSLVFVPDLKWDHTLKNALDHFYGLIIFKDKNLYSIRELDSTHIQLLEEAKHNISTYIHTTYNIDPTLIRFYFHYPPSFWWLHIHVNLINISHEGMHIDRCVSLETVIENLKLNSNYYKTVNMKVVTFM